MALYKPAQVGFVCPNPIHLELDPNSHDLMETSRQLGKFSYWEKTIPHSRFDVKHTQSIKNQSTTHLLQL